MIFDYKLPDGTTGTVNANDILEAATRVAKMLKLMDCNIGVRPSKLNVTPGPAAYPNTPNHTGQRPARDFYTIVNEVMSNLNNDIILDK